VGFHTLTIDIEDIYFLTGLSHHGWQVTLTGNRGGGDPMDYYVSHHCVPGTKKHNDKVAIRDVWYLHLWTILYSTTHISGSVAPHMSLQSHFLVLHRVHGAQGLKLVQGGPKNHEETTYQVPRWWVKSTWVWVSFGVLILAEGLYPMPIGGVGIPNP
jgi:hypothetical protein